MRLECRLRENRAARFPVLMILLSVGPVWASLEGILGRPIPWLRFSPAVKRSRVYVAAPVVMGVVWWVAAAALCGASDAGRWDWYAVLGMGFGALAGWIVFGLLEGCEAVWGVARRVWRNFG